MEPLVTDSHQAALRQDHRSAPNILTKLLNKASLSAVALCNAICSKIEKSRMLHCIAQNCYRFADLQPIASHTGTYNASLRQVCYRLQTNGRLAVKLFAIGSRKPTDSRMARQIVTVPPSTRKSRFLLSVPSTFSEVTSRKSLGPNR